MKIFGAIEGGNCLIKTCTLIILKDSDVDCCRSYILHIHLHIMYVHIDIYIPLDPT